MIRAPNLGWVSVIAIAAGIFWAGCGDSDSDEAEPDPTSQGSAGTSGAGGGGEAGGQNGGGGSGVAGSATTENVTVTKLGNLPTGATNDKWATVSVNVTDGIESFMVTALSADKKQTVSPGQITAPDGTVLFDGTATGPQPYTAIGAGAGLPFAMLFPNTPSIKLQTGTYTVLLATDSGDTSLDVSVLLKKGDGATKPSSLPVTFWFANLTFPTGAPLNKESAKTDAKFQQALGVFKTIYGNAQITVDLGAINYRDMKDVIGDAKATQYAVASDEAMLADMYADMNQFATAPGLHVYFIDQYTFQGGDGTLGISAGIPGPSAFEGVPHAGVSCGVAALFAEPGEGLDPVDDFGATIAHEGGHYLGLFHTTEKEEMNFDPIPDTPECTAVDAMNQHSPDACAGMGADNFMFWQSGNTLQSTVAPGQAYVLQMNPSVSP